MLPLLIRSYMSVHFVAHPIPRSTFHRFVSASFVHGSDANTPCAIVFVYVFLMTGNVFKASQYLRVRMSCISGNEYRTIFLWTLAVAVADIVLVSLRLFLKYADMIT